MKQVIDSKPKTIVLIKRSIPCKGGNSLFYYGESFIGNDYEEWTFERSREFIWESAIETVKLHDEIHLKKLIDFSFKMMNVLTKNTLDDCEIYSFGYIVTAGNSKKRNMFWKLIAQLSQGLIPKGLSSRLISKPNPISPFIKSNARYKATVSLSILAKKMLDNGANRQLNYKADYKVGREEEVKFHNDPISTESLLNLDAKLQWEYKSLPAWSHQI